MCESVKVYFLERIELVFFFLLDMNTAARAYKSYNLSSRNLHYVSPLFKRTINNPHDEQPKK